MRLQCWVPPSVDMAVADEQAWGLADVEDDDDTGIGSWAAWNSECGRDTPISTSTGRQDGDSHWVADEVVDAEAPRRRVSLLSSRRSFAYFMGQAKLRATPRKKNRVRHIGIASEPRRAASGKSSNAAVSALFGQRGPPSGAASGKLFADNADKDKRRPAAMGFTTGRVQQHSGTRAAGERASSSMVARRNISQPRTQRPTPNDLLSPLASLLSLRARAAARPAVKQSKQPDRPPRPALLLLQQTQQMQQTHQMQQQKKEGTASPAASRSCSSRVRTHCCCCRSLPFSALFQPTTGTLGDERREGGRGRGGAAARPGSISSPNR